MEILSPLAILPMFVHVVIVLMCSLPSVLGPSRFERRVDRFLCEWPPTLYVGFDAQMTLEFFITSSWEPPSCKWPPVDVNNLISYWNEMTYRRLACHH